MQLYFIALTCLMVLVMYFDFTKYVIPNWLNGLIGILYPIMVLTSAAVVAWDKALFGAGLVFIVGYIIFCMRWMGGGDIKLFTVTALWIGLEKLPEYIMLVAVLGGGLSLLALFLRKLVPLYYGKKDILPPRLLEMGAPLPYGLAIAAGFICYLWSGAVPGIGNLHL